MTHPFWLFVKRLGGAGGLLLFPLYLSAATLQPVAHVIQVSVDGLGALYLQDYVRAAPVEFPAFCRLMTNGASTLNARCDYLDSVTMPNHTSILTGRPMLQPDGWPDTTQHSYELDWDNGLTLHTSGNLNVPYKASVLDVVHDHGMSTAFYSGKGKFDFFTRSYDVDNGAPDAHGRNKVDFSIIIEGAYSEPPYYVSDPFVDSIVDSLTNAPRNYVFLHFAEPDYNGHWMGGWGSPAYSNSVRYVDQQLMRIFGAIDATPSLSNQVALVLTADHGGYGGGHGDYFEPYEYTLPLMVWAPGVIPATNLYSLFSNRTDPGTERVSYSDPQQPLWNGDSGNIALMLLGLPAIPGSSLRPHLAGGPYGLSVSCANGILSVSWPADAVGWGLESTPALQSGGVWNAITSNITTIGPNKVYTNSLSEALLQFYRLRNSNNEAR